MSERSFTFELICLLFIGICFIVYYFDIDTGFSFKRLLSKFGIHTTSAVSSQSTKKSLFVKSVSLLKNAKSNSKYLQDTADIKRTLYNRYFSGVPETYDTDGTKLSGHKPDIKKAIQYIKEAIVDKTNRNPEKDILDLAFIYKHGAYDMIPNPLEGAAILKSLRWVVPDSVLIDMEIQSLETGLLDDTEHEPIDEYNNTYDYEDIVPIEEIYIPVGPDLNEQFNIRRIIDNEREEPENFVHQREFQYRDDPQNFHDTSVILTTTKALDAIKNEELPVEDTGTIKGQIYSYLRSLPKTDKTRDAITALDHIYKTDAYNSKYDIKEVDALNRVWEKVIEYGPDAKEILAYELSTMVEHGIVVCSMGRISRITDTLSGLDDSVKIVPESVVKNEMLQRASVLRDQFTALHPGTELGTHPDQERLDIEFKDFVRNSLETEYVPKLVMKDKFNTIVNEWIDHI